MNEMQVVMNLILVLAVILAVWFVFSRVLKNKKLSNVTFKDFDFDIHGLIVALGDMQNILECSSTGSKVTFIVNDQECINVAKIKELGASGIVQTNNKVVIIFGKVSKVIEEYMNSKISS